MQNFLSDQFALRKQLLRRPNRCHTRYLRGRRGFPLRIPPAEELTRAGVKFQTLKALETVPPKITPPLPPFILIRIVQEKSYMHRITMLEGVIYGGASWVGKVSGKGYHGSGSNFKFFVSS